MRKRRRWVHADGPLRVKIFLRINSCYDTVSKIWCLCAQIEEEKASNQAEAAMKVGRFFHFRTIGCGLKPDAFSRMDH
jgi:hypothetical protein